MNLLKELSEKYNGNYYEDEVHSANTPYGKVVSQSIKCEIEIDGAQINIGIVINKGIAQGTNPYRLFIKAPLLKGILEIYPATYLDFILNIFSSKIFNQRINEKSVYIRNYKENSNRIFLSPPRCEDLAEMEEFIFILKRVHELI